mmetsp:Transcript_29663/g.63106  ORF Transcript_29663/g.63106 Transcript_29663/m.63106 type:complete len:293 (+) Transcript_29663:2314-3192(+)
MMLNFPSRPHFCLYLHGLRWLKISQGFSLFEERLDPLHVKHASERASDQQQQPTLCSHEYDLRLPVPPGGGFRGEAVRDRLDLQGARQQYERDPVGRAGQVPAPAGERPEEGAGSDLRERAQARHLHCRQRLERALLQADERDALPRLLDGADALPGPPQHHGPHYRGGRQGRVSRRRLHHRAVLRLPADDREGLHRPQRGAYRRPGPEALVQVHGAPHRSEARGQRSDDREDVQAAGGARHRHGEPGRSRGQARPNGGGGPVQVGQAAQLRRVRHQEVPQGGAWQAAVRGV